MPIPGSMEPCRKCGVMLVVGSTAVPAWKITGNKRSRGFYCDHCAEFLGVSAVQAVKKRRGVWRQ